MTPKWNEQGEPENMEAAASDAVQWLSLLADNMDSGTVRPQNHNEYRSERKRLGDCLAALQGFIYRDSEREW